MWVLLLSRIEHHMIILLIIHPQKTCRSRIGHHTIHIDWQVADTLFIFGGEGRKWWVCTQTTEKRGLISIPTLMACVVLGLASAIILYLSLCDERLSLTTALLARLFPLFCNKNCKIKFKCFHPKFKILQNIFHLAIAIYHE